MSADGVRINKYLADRGLCSRREAEQLIEKGWVSVNGEVLKNLGYRVQDSDDVKVNEKAQDFLGKKLTIVMNKPIGYVSGQAEGDYKPAIRLATPDKFAGPGRAPRIMHKGFAPAGRLDIDSTGLLIITQNGKLAKKIIAPDSEIEKEYLVDVEGEITDAKIKKLRYGLSIDGKKLKRADVKVLKGQRLQFILKEGKKRQIRRMCKAVDLNVTALKRVRIGELRLGRLPVGEWRLLKPTEKV